MGADSFDDVAEDDDQELAVGDRIVLRVAEESPELRLDAWLTDELGGAASRSRVEAWIRDGHVRLLESPRPARKRLKPALKVLTDQVFELTVPPPVVPDAEPRDLQLQVLFEDADLAVIIKPPGVATHPGPGDDRTTLVNGLLYLWKNLPQVQEDFRPGIVHRLDRLTEGLMVVARREQALSQLSQQFHDRTVAKEYLAWLTSVPPEPKGVIDVPLRRRSDDRRKMQVAPPGEGRRAVSHYEVLERREARSGRRFSLVRVRIETGRTHQIRVHMASLGCPVIGDPLYSRKAGRYGERFGMLLLAQKLSFSHPRSGERLDFEAAIPDRFSEFREVCAGF